ncbi:hypothetical protein FFI94_031925 [Rhodococcus sp. KBS0724]|uniref:hypothetical protein n=1 Tax=Rhodococcus sp. KBS0724 TaxID=1179674 RepID=UPI00110D8A7C|nr:hypothetical protein [Rhodococcus sp. KBS0724]TSD40344.1 hypothetical protein FFI94_031925 [Rhodococcus sp. KBS0724]
MCTHDFGLVAGDPPEPVAVAYGGRDLAQYPCAAELRHPRGGRVKTSRGPRILARLRRLVPSSPSTIRIAPSTYYTTEQRGRISETELADAYSVHTMFAAIVVSTVSANVALGKIRCSRQWDAIKWRA